MAQRNGHTEGMTIPLSPPLETAPFEIGMQVIQVPALTLFTLAKARDLMKNLSPELDWIAYADTCMQIVAIALEDVRPDLTLEVLQKSCSLSEVQKLPAEFNDLLTISGFNMGEGQAQTAESQNLGTGTSGQSPENLPPSESAAETSAG